MRAAAAGATTGALLLTIFVVAPATAESGVVPRTERASCAGAAEAAVHTMAAGLFACRGGLVLIRPVGSAMVAESRLAPAITVAGAYVDSAYRGRSEDDIVWGDVEAGRLRFTSKIHVRTILSLQSENHWFQVSYAEMGGHPVDLRMVVRVRRDISFWPDKTVDTALLEPGRQTSAWTGTVHVKNPGSAGRYFAELYNMQIGYDGQAIPVTFTIQSPRYTCYKTVPCKFR